MHFELPQILTHAVRRELDSIEGRRRSRYIDVRTTDALAIQSRVENVGRGVLGSLARRELAPAHHLSVNPEAVDFPRRVRGMPVKVQIVGIMQLAGLQFNLVNVWAFPLIIGSAAEYGLYIVLRSFESPEHGGGSRLARRSSGAKAGPTQ